MTTKGGWVCFPACDVTEEQSSNEIPVQVTFTGLSVDPIYTLGMDVPSSWLVRPREALYDLDNIQPSTLPPDGLHALFSLDYLVVEGHARETKSNSPPRGVQLQLTTSSPIASDTPSVVDDTQVVANLGYLQFKACPGTFKLTIREGGGRDVYDIASVGSEGWNSPSVEDSGEELTVMSFEGLTLYPRLSRKPGMEKVDVLAGLQQRPGHSQTIIHDILSKWVVLSFLTALVGPECTPGFHLFSDQRARLKSQRRAPDKRTSTYSQLLLGCSMRCVPLPHL
jgi:UDP-glucose:glycoprotein glucosyltransferase